MALDARPHGLGLGLGCEAVLAAAIEEARNECRLSRVIESWRQPTEILEKQKRCQNDVKKY